ncbi:hypothetical protein R69749_08414 [Paraburkholderia domus]|nr:hypothetical protein R69749_08414 [Paraburkholderia domus]
MLVKDLVRMRKIETGIPHALRNVADDPPVGARFARCRQERTLARNPALGVRDGAIFLAPAERWQQDVRKRIGIRVFNNVGADDEFAARERALRLIAVGQAHNRVRAHDPDGLDPACLDCPEQLDRLESRPLRDSGRAPERLHEFAMAPIIELQVCRQHVRESAHFTPAHRVRLPGKRERPHSRLADATGQQMAIDDAVDLVSAGGRLVHTLGINRHHPLSPREQPVELEQIVPVDLAALRALREVKAVRRVG